MKVMQLLGLQGPWQHLGKCSGTQTASVAGVLAPSESFLEPLVAGDQKEGLFGQSFSVALPIHALRGIRCLGSFSIIWHVGQIEGSSDWGPTL